MDARNARAHLFSPSRRLPRLYLQCEFARPAANDRSSRAPFLPKLTRSICPRRRTRLQGQHQLSRHFSWAEYTTARENIQTARNGSAGGGARTHTILRSLDFESSASASSATPAFRQRGMWKLRNRVQTSSSSDKIDILHAARRAEDLAQHHRIAQTRRRPEQGDDVDLRFTPNDHFRLRNNVVRARA